MTPAEACAALQDHHRFLWSLGFRPDLSIKALSLVNLGDRRAALVILYRELNKRKFK